MATNYPGGVDDNNVTSLPEETPLSQAGPGAILNHPELHQTTADGIEALQIHASQKTHDHSGGNTPTAGPKLAQANTHENADTNTSPAAIHHSLDTVTGATPNKAAPANHTHDYNDTARLLNTPLRTCTSSTRPNSPALGLIIYETDTYRMRVWAQYPGEGSPSWHYLLGPLPTIRLRQGANQKFDSGTSGTIVEWREELEDTYNSFDKNVSLTNVTIRESALYSVTAAIQWDTQFVPDQAHVVVKLNGVDTTVRQSQYLRGSGFNPGFSQTITATGPLRMNANDVLTVKVWYVAPGGLLNKIFSLFDPDSKINSRLDVVYQGA